jgi:DNA-binding NarL/FixJ family response regulator
MPRSLDQTFEVGKIPIPVAFSRIWAEINLKENICDTNWYLISSSVRNLLMRPTRLVYIENDPALRKILGEILSKSPDLELIASFSGSDEAMNREIIRKADVALVDFSLDQNGLNGVELGIALRNINEYIGIVIYSQFSVRPMVNRVPKTMRAGWSFFNKSADMTVENYAKILKSTASGKGNWEEFLQEEDNSQETEASIFFTLTPRQRSIMSLSVQSKSPQDIAEQLGLSYSYVRKELSRAYAVLLPNAKDSDDLKTAAVLKYMELMKIS